MQPQPHTQLQVWKRKKTKLSEPSRSSHLRKGPGKTVSPLYENKLPVPVLKMLLRGVSEDPQAWQVHSMSTLTGPLSLSDKELSPQANSTCCLRQEEAGTASRAQNPSRAEQGWEAGVSSSWG